MGCSASTGTVAEAPDCYPVAPKDEKPGRRPSLVGDASASTAGLRAVREEGRSCLDDSISVASSARTVGSLPSNKTSLFSGRFHYSKRASSSNEDVLSDVPTITESIADMQDLSELAPTRSGTRCACGVVGFACAASCPFCASSPSRVDGALAASLTLGGSLFIDNRPHPLAPLSSCHSHTDERETVAGSNLTLLANSADLGVAEDVPSMRDDSSIISAASDINLMIIANQSPPVSERGRSTTPTSSSSRLRRQGSGARNSGGKETNLQGILRQSQGAHDPRSSTGSTLSSPPLVRGGLAMRYRQQGTLSPPKF